ncbi:heparan-alpha-glucosaminide N-acetyltransferase [Gammaproteobacteria bacterium]
MIKFKTKSTNRLLSLDVFRGFTIASMVLVNNPGSREYVFSPFKHTAWHGWSFADLIFPSFLWIAGVAITLSFTKYIDQNVNRNQLLQHVFWRSLALFSIGLFLNGFPFGIASNYFSWATFRIPGVLQRIAICYFIASLIFIYSKFIWQVAWTMFFLVSSWLLIKIVPVPGFGVGVLEPAGSLAWYIDASLLHGHTYIGAPISGFDPEGIFSTLPAIATMLFGVLTGHLLKLEKTCTEKTVWMLFFGSILVLFGLLMDYWLPINKNLWTSSYAVFTSGVALMFFTCCYWLIDVKKYQKWFKPLEIYGMNALTIFVISGIIGRLTRVVTITELAGTSSLKEYYYNFLFLPLGNSMLVSLLHAIVFVLFMYLIAYMLYREQLIIRA